MDILETELVDHGVDGAFRRIVTGPDEEINLAEAALLLAPDEAREIRDRAGVYENLLCYRAAHADYVRYLALAPYHEGAGMVRLRCERLRYKLERLH